MVSENYAWTSRFKRSDSDKKHHNAGFYLLWSKTWFLSPYIRFSDRVLHLSSNEWCKELKMTEQVPWWWDMDGAFTFSGSSRGQKSGQNVALTPLNVMIFEAKWENITLWPSWVCSIFPAFLQWFKFANWKIPSTLTMTTIWKEEYFTQNI